MLTAATKIKPSVENNIKTTALTTAFIYIILVKANRSTTLFLGEGFHVPIQSGVEHDTVEIDPRKEALPGLITAHIQKIETKAIYIQNKLAEPVRIKKNILFVTLKR